MGDSMGSEFAHVIRPSLLTNRIFVRQEFSVWPIDDPVALWFGLNRGGLELLTLRNVAGSAGSRVRAKAVEAVPSRKCSREEVRQLWADGILADLDRRSAMTGTRARGGEAARLDSRPRLRAARVLAGSVADFDVMPSRRSGEVGRGMAKLREHARAADVVAPRCLWSYDSRRLRRGWGFAHRE